MALVLAASIAFMGSPAFAQKSSGADAEQADALFRTARELMIAGRPTEACPIFEQSIALDPAIGAFLNLGRCYEQTDRPASALAAYEEAARRAQSAGDLTRVQLATKQAELVRRAVPQIALTLPKDDPLESVFLDGRLLAPSQWAQTIPADPGKHEISVRRPGETIGPSFEVRVPRTEVGEPQVIVSLIVSLPPRSQTPEPKALDSASPKEAGANQNSKADPGTIVPADPPEPRTNPIRTAAWVGLSVGGLAVVTGVVLGIDAMSRAAGSDCDANLQCSSEGRQTRESARDELIAGYAVGISGAILATISGIVLATAPNRGRHRVQADVATLPGGARIALRYRF